MIYWGSELSIAQSITRSSDPQLLDSGFDRLNADDPAVRAVALEPHAARDLRVDRIVLAEAGIESRTEAPPALPDDDRAAGDEVAVVRFHAEALRVGVAPVAGAALSFFVSHCCRVLQNDVLDSHARVDGPVALRPAHALATLLLEHANLRAARLAVDDGDDAGIGHVRRTGENFTAVLLDEQHGLERHFRARLADGAVDEGGSA